MECTPACHRIEPEEMFSKKTYLERGTLGILLHNGQRGMVGRSPASSQVKKGFPGAVQGLLHVPCHENAQRTAV